MTEKKKFLKSEQLTDRVGWSFLNSEVRMLPAGQVQKASRAVCEMPQRPIDKQGQMIDLL